MAKKHTSPKPVSYTNRRNKTYYLHAAKTKKGAVRYVMKTTKTEGVPIALPEGMEITEGPNGEVSVGRIRPRVIHRLEVQLVQEKLDDLELRGYRALAKDQYITVYEPTRSVADIEEINKICMAPQRALLDVISRILPEGDPELTSIQDHFAQNKGNPNAQKIDTIMASARVEPVMRFVLSDKVKRLFSVERMTYRGNGDWLWLSRSVPLQKAANEYLHHLGQDSFFELM